MAAERPATVGTETERGVERHDFVERVVPYVPRPVGGAIEVVVVEQHDDPVLGEVQIGLEEAEPEVVRLLERVECVLRPQQASATMRESGGTLPVDHGGESRARTGAGRSDRVA